MVYQRDDAKSKNSGKNIGAKKLIIKKEAKIFAFDEYMIVRVGGSDMIFGYRHIDEVYINVTNKVPLNILYKLSTKKKVFLIDRFGYIVGELKCEKSF
ncbi:MAG: hypothetical protein GXO01_07330 [Epsilonproteobacteria bacterium]|nr:hypothetical protein [Campylobacterota bacterium]